MKKEQKTELTKERILKASLQEFGTNGYEGTTVNSICSKHEIAKGLLYHNFKGKDDVYIICVKECFHSLTECLKSNIQMENLSPENQLKEYFSARVNFFHRYPLYQRIFCDAVIFPPAHLQEEIKRTKQEFDDLNARILSGLIENLNLRSDVSKEEIIETFQQYQDFINAKYQMLGTQEIDFKAHEERCYRALNIMLYGVIYRK